MMKSKKKEEEKKENIFLLHYYIYHSNNKPIHKKIIYIVLDAFGVFNLMSLLFSMKQASILPYKINIRVGFLDWRFENKALKRDKIDIFNTN